MPRCSSAQRSVASAWREKRKQVVSRVRGVGDDVTCPFLHSGVVKILKAGQVHTNDPFCCPNSPLQSSYIWFAGWPKPYSYRRAQNRLNNSRVKLCHVRYGKYWNKWILRNLYDHCSLWMCSPVRLWRSTCLCWRPFVSRLLRQETWSKTSLSSSPN